MTPASKRRLTSEEKAQLGIPDSQRAYLFTLEKVIEERCDEFENELEFEGYEILQREHITIAASIFNFKVVALAPD